MNSESLTFIPDELMNLTSLDCSGCTSLISLPKKLPAINLFNCQGCLRLIQRLDRRTERNDFDAKLPFLD